MAALRYSVSDGAPDRSEFLVFSRDVERQFERHLFTESVCARDALHDVLDIIAHSGGLPYLYQSSAAEVMEAIEYIRYPSPGREVWSLKELDGDGATPVNVSLEGRVLHFRCSNQRVRKTVDIGDIVNIALGGVRVKLTVIVPRTCGMVRWDHTFVLDDEALEFYRSIEALLSGALGALSEPRPRVENDFIRLVDQFWPRLQRFLDRSVRGPDRVGYRLVGDLATEIACAEDQEEDSSGEEDGGSNVVARSEEEDLHWAVASCLARYWHEDVERGVNHRDDLRSNHVIYMNMVDFYLSLQDWGSKVCIGQPVIIRTLDIVKPCGSDGHRTYTFEDNKLVYRTTYQSAGVVSSKEFTHEVWQWQSGDVLRFGDFIYRVRVRKAEQSLDHCFVMLVPMARIPATLEQTSLALLSVNPLYVHSSAYKGFWWTALQALAHHACSPFLTGLDAALSRDLNRGEVEEVALISGLRSRGSLGDVLVAFLTSLRSRPERLAGADLKRFAVNIKGASGGSFTVLQVTQTGKTFEKRKAKAVKASKSLTPQEGDDKPVEVALGPADLERSLVRISAGKAEVYHEFTLQQYEEGIAMVKCGPTEAMEQLHIREPDRRGFLLNFLRECKGVDTTQRLRLVVYSYGLLEMIPCRMRSIQLLMDPLVCDVQGPISNASNEAAGANARITTLLQTPWTKLTPEMMGFIRDFVAGVWAFTRLKGKLSREGLDATLARQNTPGKKASIVRSATDLFQGEPTSRPFVKMEHGAEAPRIVCPIEDRSKSEFQAYIEPLTRELLHALPFCTCGMTPEQTENEVRRVAGAAFDLVVIEGDIRRMDGHVDALSRVLFTLIGDAFKPSQRRGFHRAHRASIARKCKSRHGVKWTTGKAMPSGSSDTTSNNTLANGCMIYIAKRMAGASHAEAFQWLCSCVLVSGDDSVIVQIDADELAKGYVACGQVPKIQVRRNENFTYLARMYGTVDAVRCGVTNNCQDPSRIWTKFVYTHQKLARDEDRHQILHYKACAVMTNDGNSFGISNVARCILNATKKRYGWVFEENYTSKNYTMATGKYTNQACDWFEEVTRKVHPRTDFTALVEWFSEEQTLEDIERHPCFTRDSSTPLDPAKTHVQLDIEHGKAEFVSDAANIEKGDPDGVPDVSNPHFPEGTKIVKQQKAYRLGHDINVADQQEFMRSYPVPACTKEHLAELEAFSAEYEARHGVTHMAHPMFWEEFAAVRKWHCLNSQMLLRPEYAVTVIRQVTRPGWDRFLLGAISGEAAAMAQVMSPGELVPGSRASTQIQVGLPPKEAAAPVEAPKAPAVNEPVVGATKPVEQAVDKTLRPGMERMLGRALPRKVTFAAPPEPPAPSPPPSPSSDEEEREHQRWCRSWESVSDAHRAKGRMPPIIGYEEPAPLSPLRRFWEWHAGWDWDHPEFPGTVELIRKKMLEATSPAERFRLKDILGEDSDGSDAQHYFSGPEEPPVRLYTSNRAGKRRATDPAVVPPTIVEEPQESATPAESAEDLLQDLVRALAGGQPGPSLQTDQAKPETSKDSDPLPTDHESQSSEPERAGKKTRRGKKKKRARSGGSDFDSEHPWYGTDVVRAPPLVHWAQMGERERAEQRMWTAQADADYEVKERNELMQMYMDISEPGRSKAGAADTIDDADFQRILFQGIIPTLGPHARFKWKEISSSD